MTLPISPAPEVTLVPHKRELKLRGRMQRLAAIRVLERAAAPAEAAADAPVAAEASRPHRIPVSSEVPVLSYDWSGDPYYEVLGHAEGEADLTRFAAGGAIRDTHYGEQVGSVANPSLENGECFVDAGFMSSVKGQEYDAGVRDGHIQNVSLGYDVGPAMAAGHSADGIPIYRFSWRAYHVAMVPDPADFRVGFGRDGEPGAEQHTIPVRTTGTAPKEEQGMLIPKPRMDQAPDVGPGGGSVATIDVVAERQRAVQNERDRVRDIEDIAEMHSVDRATVREWIEKDTSFRDVAAAIRAKKATRGPAQPSAEQVEGLGFSERDAKKYSLMRALRIGGSLRGVGGFDEKFDGIEREAHDEIVTRSGRNAQHGGILIPWRTSKTGRSLEEIRMRAMGSTVSGGGAETVFEAAGDLIELLVPQSALIGSGVAVTSGLTGSIAYPKETEDVDGYWTSENPPAPVTQTEQKFGVIQLSPRTLMASMYWPRQLLMQSSIDMEARGRMRMTSKIGRMLDRGGLHGTGTNGQVTGIFNTPGVLTSDDLGGVGDYADFLKMVGSVAAVEGDTLGSQGWLTTPEYAAALASKLKDSSVSGYLWPTDPGTIRKSTLVGYDARSSNQVSKTLGSGDKHGILYGTLGQAEFAFWGAIEGVVDELTLARYAQVQLTLFQMADFAVKYPEAFIIGVGAKP